MKHRGRIYPESEERGRKRQWYLEEIASLGCGPEPPSVKAGGGFLQLVWWLVIQGPHLHQSWFRQDSK